MKRVAALLLLITAIGGLTPTRAQKARAKPSAEAALPPGRPIPPRPIPQELLGKPNLLNGSPVAYPEAARAIGAHGTVVVSGTVSIDGKFEDLRVSTSSRSTILDEAALTAARGAIFSPAIDANHAKIAAPYEMTREFYGYQSSRPGGGLQYYRCHAFVRDMDWWHANWPEVGYEKDQLYTMILGIDFIVGMQSPGFRASDLKRGNEIFAKNWQATIDACRAKPDALFIDTMKPNAKYARALSRLLQ